MSQLTRPQRRSLIRCGYGSSVKLYTTRLYNWLIVVTDTAGEQTAHT